MALDAVEEVYQPVATRDALLGTVRDDEAGAIEAALDVFQYLQPQVLLAGAALAEAFERPRVGGEGRPDPRELRPREAAHLQRSLPPPDPDLPLLREIAATLQLDEAPQLYATLANWPPYLAASWDELQHLAAYPDFRRRGRALYYYARSGSRFLAAPLAANHAALTDAGVSDEEIEIAHAIVDASVPALATMVMHGTAMRLALGHTEREVVGTP